MRMEGPGFGDRAAELAQTDTAFSQKKTFPHLSLSETLQGLKVYKEYVHGEIKGFGALQWVEDVCIGGDGADGEDVMRHVTRAALHFRLKKELLELYKAMKQSTDGVPGFIYAALIQASVNANDVMLAAKLFKEMKNSSEKGCTEDKVVGKAYTSLIIGYERSGKYSDALSMYDEMCARGFLPDKYAFCCGVESAVKMGDMEKATSIFEEMRQEKFSAAGGVPPLSFAFACSSIVKGYGERKDANKVKELMADLRTQAIPLNSVVYSTIVNALVTCGDVKAAEGVIKELVDAMQSPPSEKNGTPSSPLPPPDAYAFTALIKGLGKQRELDKAFAVLDTMEQLEIEPTATTYNTLINVCVEAADVSRGARAYVRMCNRGVSPNVVTFNSLIKLYSAANDFNAALSVFDVMKRRGVNANAVTYNSILDVCVSMDYQFERGREIYAVMKAAGVPPDVYTFNAMIRGMTKLTDLKGVSDVLRDMVAAEVTPNQFTPRLILNAYFRCGRREQGLRFFAEIRGGDFRTDGTLSRYLSEGNFHKGSGVSEVAAEQEDVEETEAGAVVERLPVKGRREWLSGFVYDVVIHELLHSRLRRVYVAVLWDEMKRKGFQPDERLCCTLVSSGAPYLINRVDSELAQPLASGDRSRFLSGSSATWQFAVVAALSRGAHVKTLLQILRKVLKVRAGVGGLDATVYNGLMAQYMRSPDADVDQAFEIRDEMKEAGMDLTMAPITYHALIRLCARTGNPQNALALLNEMEANGIQPQTDTFNILKDYMDGLLVQKCLAATSADQLPPLLDSMCASGFSPNVDTYNTLLQEFAKSRAVDHALVIYGHMRNSNVEPNEDTLNMVVKACVRGGHVERTIPILDEMKKRGFHPALAEHDLLKIYMDQLFGEVLSPPAPANGSIPRAASPVSDPLAALDDLELRMGIRPTLATYNALIQSICRERKIEEALALLHDMQAAGVHPDVFTYNQIMDTCVRSERYDLAMKLFHSLRWPPSPSSPQHQPDTSHSPASASASGPGPGPDPSPSSSPPHVLRPDAYTYSILLKCYVALKKVREGLALVEDMRELGIPLTVVIYNELINLCLDVNQTDQALVALREMEEVDGLKPDVVTYTTLIKGVGKGNPDSAFRIFERMEERGIGADVWSLDTLVDVAAENQRWDLGLQALSKMECAGFPVDMRRHSVKAILLHADDAITAAAAVRPSTT
eukprot:CAMPEP_0184658068 /NCGR_PEP_ID=MMETSP0308-20130426/23359_1 /TAXON_ID=38269 /ORGANISM="Gloeochaete witrockiana, Strain SAG 46.84" /LENGTH=1204 /DNA_ID=CAMNT_0027096659 /DNA_START=176 /DNA_END=3794 /DNA_ORIENTATION=-